MADLYSTLEEDYVKCLLEHFEEDLTPPKAVILRDKIKGCIHVGNELILMTKEHPVLRSLNSADLGKSAIERMRKDVEKLEKIIKAGGGQEFNLS